MIQIHILVILEDNKYGEIIIEYNVSRDGKINTRSTTDDTDDTANTDCRPGAYCAVTDDETRREILTQLNAFIPSLQLLSNTEDKNLSIDNIKVISEDIDGIGNDDIVIEYQVTKDGIDPETFKVNGNKQHNDDITN
mmetsp:Transcript_46730/g.41800  ORF Transcript_46730/g.41800 Transcript_46730/m.41800 type:complete len:137 (+) Transcript_46730:290-700(+)